MSGGDLWAAVVLGLVEGATEFLPVSSTGHLIVVGEWLHFDGARAKTFEIFIQLGAILAIVWLYRAKLWTLLRRLGTDPVARRLVANVVVAFLPAAVVGFLAHDWIKATLFGSFTVALALITGGVIMLAIEAWAPRTRTDRLDDVPLSSAFGVGLAQVLSLIPGTSRSAATIMGGYCLGLSRTVATEFSFLLAIPVMVAATMYDLLKSAGSLTPADIPLFAVGFLVAFVSAVVIVRGFLQFVAGHTFRVFAWYRIAFGLLVLYLARR